jgi:hypothetical protein
MPRCRSLMQPSACVVICECSERATRTSPRTGCRILAQDDVRPVRLWTARHLATPADALEMLARDDDEAVRWNVLLNPCTPDAALRWLADVEARKYGDRHFLERQRILRHPQASAELRAAFVGAGCCPWRGGGDLRGSIASNDA